LRFTRLRCDFVAVRYVWFDVCVVPVTVVLRARLLRTVCYVFMTARVPAVAGTALRLFYHAATFCALPFVPFTRLLPLRLYRFTYNYLPLRTAFVHVARLPARFLHGSLRYAFGYHLHARYARCCLPTLTCRTVVPAFGYGLCLVAFVARCWRMRYHRSRLRLRRSLRYHTPLPRIYTTRVPRYVIRCLDCHDIFGLFTICVLPAVTRLPVTVRLLHSYSCHCSYLCYVGAICSDRCTRYRLPHVYVGSCHVHPVTRFLPFRLPFTCRLPGSLPVVAHVGFVPLLVLRMPLPDCLPFVTLRLTCLQCRDFTVRIPLHPLVHTRVVTVPLPCCRDAFTCLRTCGCRTRSVTYALHALRVRARWLFCCRSIPHPMPDYHTVTGLPHLFTVTPPNRFTLVCRYPRGCTVCSHTFAFLFVLRAFCTLTRLPFVPACRRVLCFAVPVVT